MKPRTICPLGEPCLNPGNCVDCQRYTMAGGPRDGAAADIDRQLRAALAEAEARYHRNLTELANVNLEALNARDAKLAEAERERDETRKLADALEYAVNCRVEELMPDLRADLAAARDALEATREEIAMRIRLPSRSQRASDLSRLQKLVDQIDTALQGHRRTETT